MEPTNRALPMLALLLAAAAADPAAPANILVTTTADVVGGDNSSCSLREAVGAANFDLAIDGCIAGSGTDTILLPAGTYTLTRAGRDEDVSDTGDLDLLANVVLRTLNNGEVTVDAGGIDRVLEVHSGVLATLQDLQITGGQEFSQGGGGIMNRGELSLLRTTVRANSTTVHGGGILSDGPLTLTQSEVRNNVAGSNGGGIFSTWASSEGGVSLLWSSVIANSADGVGGGVHARRLLMEHSTVALNVAEEHGGGLAWPTDAGHFDEIVNSTVSGNLSEQHGGGLHYAGLGILHLRNVTITDNTADSDSTSAGDGGGIHVPQSPQVRLWNTILADNHDLSGAAPLAVDCLGSLDSEGYNLIGEAPAGTCDLVPAAGDQIGSGGVPIDPRLRTLEDAGGPTMTHLPEAESPAIDEGDPAGCSDGMGLPLTVDQRGNPRPLDGNDDSVARCDIGATERDDIFRDGFESGNLSAWG